MRKPRPFSALVALLLALTLVAAACSDNADETTEAAAADDMEMSDDSEMSDDMDEHDHGSVLEVPEGMAVPAIEISAEADTVSGHNLMIELTDFSISPENASTDPVDGEGHLHLYINGERQMRFYNTALHLSGLPEGEHEVEVEISANNHSAYGVDGEPIRATTTISVGEAMEHAHSDELFESAVAPVVDLTITEDPKSGWNLFADVEGFTFAPENAGGEAVDGEGHLHLYVDGERVTRLYGPWWHLSGLDEGDHEIMVEVSGNDHTVYAVDGEPVMAMTTLTVSAEQATADGGHDGDDESHDGGDESHDDHGGDESHDGDDDESHAHGGDGETLDIAAADADVVISGALTGDDLDMEERRIEVEEGQSVGIIFEADIEEEIHLHGYDILSAVGPDTTAEFAFLADSPGTFEVELEQSGRFLFEIQVR